MKKTLVLAAAVFLVAMGVRAFGDYTATQGAGSTVFAFVCSVSKICPAQVPINSSNVEIFTASNPAQVSLANTGANATAVKVDNSAVTQPVSGTVTANLGTIAGVATAANQSTEITALNSIVTNTGAAIPAGSNLIGNVKVVDTGGTNQLAVSAGGAASVAPIAGTNRIGYVSDDPCTQLTKTPFTISTSSGTLQIVAPSGSTQVYICSLAIIGDTPAVKVNVVGGTGATCTTGTPVALMGSTTAANGMSLAANGGLTFGNGGATVIRTTTGGHGVCIVQSGTTLLAGGGTYIQQ